MKVGKKAQDVTRENTDNFRNQLKRLAISYDWNREIITSEKEYYKWTQWVVLQLWKEGLLYKKLAAVNWCPKCQTVLANEQVVNGKCERDDTDVEQKEMLQWFVNITRYADELVDGLDSLDWPEESKKLQKNWIGRRI
jgi:leucyl-tRNA synthetase